jgi:hypothetical protein
MSWQDRAENFADLVKAIVLEQFPEVLPIEPNPGFFIWRYGSNIVHMMVDEPTGTVTLRFVEEGEATGPQALRYAVESVPQISAAIVEWLNFRRTRRRGI